MLKTPVINGQYLTGSSCLGQNSVDKLPSDHERDSGPSWDCRHKTGNSRQVLCRELTLFADRGSERPVSRDRTRDRVDFHTEGYLDGDQGICPVTEVKGSTPTEPWSPSKYLSVWAIKVARHRPQVLDGYPPYSRSAQGRTHAGGWGSGMRNYAQRIGK